MDESVIEERKEYAPVVAFNHTPIEDILRAPNPLNILELLDERMVTQMGQEAQSGYESDYSTMAKWCDNNTRVKKLVEQEIEEKTYPFAGASNVKFPLVTEAVLQFNARAYSTIMNNGNIALAKVIGADPDGMKKRRADRVSRDMSFQLTEEIDNWDGEMDRLLMGVAQDGCAFKKAYYDPIDRKVCAVYVPADDFVVDNSTKSLASCPRATHRMALYKYEVLEKVGIGLFDDDVLAYFDNEDVADQQEFGEQYTLFDVDGDGYPEPYIVIFHIDSGKVCNVQPDYDEDSIIYGTDGETIVAIKKRSYFAKYECFPAPRGEFYTPGFGSLLLQHNESINTILNQLIDAGHLANSQSGLLSREFRVRSGTMRVSPGQWLKTDVPAIQLQQSIMPMPVRDPSPVLFQLLGILIDSGKSIASLQDAITGDAPANQPAATTMALIEQGMKVYNTIFKRIYRGLRDELRLIFDLNKEYRSNEEYKLIQDDPEASVDDYREDNLDIAPAADPNMATDMQRQMRMQALMQTISLPFVNAPKIYQDYLADMGFRDPQQYLAPAQNGPSPDQLSELAKLENERQKIELEKLRVLNETRKTMVDGFEKLQKIAEQGGDLGTALAEMGIIDHFAVQQNESLEEMDKAKNAPQQPAVPNQGPIPGMEGIQPMAMGPAGGPNPQQ